MVWRRLFGQQPTDQRPPDVPVPEGARTATHGGPLPRPAAPSAPPPAPTDAQRARRVADLRRRRDAILFDVEQAELARRPDNPWSERAALLGDAIATVETDLATLAAHQPEIGFPLPATPIRDIAASAADGGQISVAFAIGDEAFRFGEEVDWDQRGGAVVRGEFRHHAGDPAALVPVDAPPHRREVLARHLTDSLFVFATDLRNRALAGEPLPTAPTLADLARPCAECGGWADWHARCPECLTRDRQRRELSAEAERLHRDRAAEDEDRHKWAERLPIARRRLADVEADLAALGADNAEAPRR